MWKLGEAYTGSTYFEAPPSGCFPPGKFYGAERLFVFSLRLSTVTDEKPIQIIHRNVCLCDKIRLGKTTFCPLSLSLGSSMVRASHLQSDGCGFDPRVKLKIGYSD